MPSARDPVATQTTFNFRLSQSLRAAIAELAAAADRSEGWVARRAISEYVDRRRVETASD